MCNVTNKQSGMNSLIAEKLKVADFLEMEGEPGFIYELINGEIVKKGAPNPKHQLVSGKLFRAITTLVDKKNLGTVLYVPLDVFMGEYNALQPDLLFVAKAREEIITSNGVEGAPDLIVEILSPSTMKHDRGDKMKIYRKHQVREYWIVDPKNQSIEVYQLKNNEYDLASFAVEEGEIMSEVLPGLSLAVTSIF